MHLLFVFAYGQTPSPLAGELQKQPPPPLAGEGWVGVGVEFIRAAVGRCAPGSFIRAAVGSCGAFPGTPAIGSIHTRNGKRT